MSAPILTPSRRTRRTPFSARVEAAGVRGYTVYNHMLLPTIFESVEADCAHLKRAVQVWDVAVERQVELVGPDAARLAQMMTPRDLGKIAVGRCAYAPICDERGGVLNDPVILKLAEDRFWLSLADSDILLWAKGLALGFGLEVAIDEPDVAPLAVQGPRAEDLMADVFGERVRAIRFFAFERLAFREHAFVVARSGWSAQGGFEIYVEGDAAAEPLWDALMHAGRAMDVRAGCPNGLERVESGLLSYGNDMTRTNDPFECGLGKYCDGLAAGRAFIGRAALERIAREGHGQEIRGLRIGAKGERLPGCVAPWSATVDGARVGQVTSAAFSPDLDATVAIGMIARAHWTPGAAVSVETPAGPRPAVVTTLPHLRRA